ncbi:hypothetical protein C8J57DRAFT_1086593, partial [Mycena rebaudengoi]
SQNAMNLHIRALWGLTKATDVPPESSNAIIQHFNGRFDSTEKLSELRASLRKSKDNPGRAGIELVDSLHKEIRLQRSPIAKNISRMGDTFLNLMFSAVLTAGLSSWCPDPLGSLDSMYNQVHEIVAIESFQVVAIAFGYAHMNIDLARIQNPILLRDLYRSFIYSYIAGLVRKEANETGGLARASFETNAYRRRVQLGERRESYFIDQGYPSRIVRLVSDVECTSDDEGPVVETDSMNVAHLVYYVNSKEARNATHTAFNRGEDIERINAALALGKGQHLKSERARKCDPRLFSNF